MPDLGSKLFDTLLVFLKEFFLNVDFEKNQQTTKKYARFPSILDDSIIKGETDWSFLEKVLINLSDQ